MATVKTRQPRSHRRRPQGASSSRWRKAPSTEPSTRSTATGKPYPCIDTSPGVEKGSAATAAFRVLAPCSQRRITRLSGGIQRIVDAIPDGKRKDKGIAVGERPPRRCSVGHDSRAVIGSTFVFRLAGRGSHRPTRSGCQAAILARGWRTPAVRGEERLATCTAGPLPLGSAAYAAEFEEVNAIGSLEQRHPVARSNSAAAFWQTNPSANRYAIGRRFVDQFSLNVSDSAACSQCST